MPLKFQFVCVCLCAWVGACAHVCMCVTETQPLGSHSVVGRNVDGVTGGVVFHGQAQVSDGRRAVLLHQDVFRLKVSVSNAGFAFKQTHQMRKLTSDS